MPSLSIAAVAVAILFAGCAKKSPCAEKGVVVEVAGDHQHTATVPADPVEREVGGTYPVKEANGHEHAFVLKDDDMKKLKAGEQVTTRTTSVQGHTHELGARCGE